MATTEQSNRSRTGCAGRATAPPTGPVAALSESLLGDARMLGLVQRRMLGRVGEFERRGAYRSDGANSMASWLMARLSLSYPTARSWVEVGTALGELPCLSEGLARGAVSFDQLRLLVAVATPSTDADLAERAGAWSLHQTADYVRTEQVRRQDAERRRRAEAERVCCEEAARRAGASPPGDGPAADGATAEPPTAGAPDSGGTTGAGPASLFGEPAGTPVAPRGPGLKDPGPGGLAPERLGTLRLRPSADGGILEGWFPREDFFALEQALLARAKQMAVDPLTGRQAPLAERQAQVLLETMLGRHSTEDPGGTVRPLVPSIVVHADIGLLDATADGQEVAMVPGHGPIPGEVLRRLACEANVRLALDHNGITLDLGRSTRVPSVALTQAVLRRDERCRFPGCTERRFLQIHHVVHWGKEGPTDLDNLAAHCIHHHHRIHHDAWTVSGHANATLTYRSRDGTTLTSVPSPNWDGPRRRRSQDRPQR